jgi:hypothetical protein
MELSPFAEDLLGGGKMNDLLDGFFKLDGLAGRGAPLSAGVSLALLFDASVPFGVE